MTQTEAAAGRGAAAFWLGELLEPFGGAASRTCAERLLRTFGSLGAVLAADTRRRDRLLADAPAVARHLAAIRGAMLHALGEEALAGEAITSAEDLARYLRASMAWLPVEQVRVLFLGAGNRLLLDEAVAAGGVGEAALPIRDIVHRALDLGAVGLILVHNHPSGDPSPSVSDLEATHRLAAACRPLGLAVHDHLIVAREGWTSLRLRELM